MDATAGHGGMTLSFGEVREGRAEGRTTRCWLMIYIFFCISEYMPYIQGHIDMKFYENHKYKKIIEICPQIRNLERKMSFHLTTSRLARYRFC